MSIAMPSHAMVLAAGLGLRMRPLTLTTPKPLIRVAGQPLIDHTLDRLDEAHVEAAVVNVHHLADQMRAHLRMRARPRIAISDEGAALLDSGGGVVKALPLLGTAPFFVVNADTFWIDGARPNLAALSAGFDSARMDVLLLLVARANAVGFHGKGDFVVDDAGHLTRANGDVATADVYAGCGLFHPRVFDDAPRGAFSLNAVFDRAAAAGRLFGHRLEGLWLHVGTPEAIADAEAAIAQLRRGR